MLDISMINSRNVEGLKLGEMILSSDKNYIYHISIIDYLQKYTMQKKIEHCYKHVVLGVKRDDISSINVKRYSSRFMEFMKEKVFNFDFNHNIDVCQLNAALEGLSRDSNIS